MADSLSDIIHLYYSNSDSNSDTYSLEERVLLTAAILQAHTEKNSQMIKKGYPQSILGMIGIKTESGLAWDIDSLKDSRALSAPYDDLPLFINDEDVFNSAIARWRLHIGR